MSGCPRRDELFELLDAALRLPAGEREPMVRSAAADPAVREEAVAMLRDVSAVTDRPGADWTAAPSLAGVTFGDFRLLRPIGFGASGVVYEAEQRVPLRKVALKVFRSGGPDAGANAAAEAQALHAVRHPGIASVLAAGTATVHDGACVAWIAMELVEGARTAAERAGEMPGDQRGLLALMRDFASALGAAHRAGILHRDLKPANLLVSSDGTAKIVDFGIAAAAGTEDGPAGTPRWMAPERAAGAVATARSDVWSLGRVMEHCANAAGLPAGGPFRAAAAMAMAPSPDARYADAGEMADDLRAALEGRPMRCMRLGPARRLFSAIGRKPRTAAVIVAAVAAVAASLWFGIGARSLARARMLLDVPRMLAMHDQIARMIDETPPDGVASAAERIRERARLGLQDIEQGPDTVLVGVASLARLGQLERACELADEGISALRSAGAGDEALRWLAAMVAACEAAGDGATGEALDDLAKIAFGLSANSVADDVLLGCYVEGIAAQTGDPRLRELAWRLDREYNDDPAATAFGTALALVAMGHDAAPRLDAGKLRSVAEGIDRWATWPMREPNASMYLSLLVQAFQAADRSGDLARFDDAVPLARAAAARYARADATVRTEIWIGVTESRLGQPLRAARTLDRVAGLPEVQAVNADSAHAWLPTRALLALESQEPAAAVDGLLATVARAPVLGTDQPSLLEVLREWRAGNQEAAGRSFGAWWSSAGEKRRAWRARIGDRLLQLGAITSLPPREDDG